ncbi:MAG: hypothetical protein E3J96_05710 [Sulfurovum sp.]|nr:MAG: hypothetical protein E3J96_05710 [Sulfurovum sp.]
MQNQAMVQEIMRAFAVRTGLIGNATNPKRYLWTDAFAVCNFLGLYQDKGDIKYKDLALKLVDQVHQRLGHYSPEDSRSGWISGLSEEEGKKHPTQGGLRIGKPILERREDEPYDAQLEWDRDGQYFHYLTKWMHALSCVTQVTGDNRYNRWAIELAKSAHAKFTYTDASIMQKRMVWKMSVDLSRSLVSSMGQHDALDAWIIYNELQAVARLDSSNQDVLDLYSEIEEAKNMCQLSYMATDDPLGLGGLLSDAYLFAQVMPEERAFIHKMLQNSYEGFHAYLKGDNRLNYPALYRLAFRELGLAIGLKAIKKMQHLFPDEPLVENQERYQLLADEIIHFWLSKENQQNSTWQEHIDINSVMLATALAPEGYHELHKGEDHGK